jgi:CRP-like cAMP-binding protein
MEKYLDFIQDVPLFRGIARDDLSGMLSCLGAFIRSYRKEEYILLAGDPVKLVGVVLSGEVCVLKEDAQGNRRIVTTVQPKSIFAEVFAFAQVAESPVTVQALTDAQVLFVDFRRITTLCTNACAFHSRLIQNILMLVAEKNILLNEKLDILGMKTTRQKVAAFLLNQQAVQGKKKRVRLPFSRTELADYLGVNRSALSRELGRMRDEGLIEFKRDTFVLSDALRFEP